MRYLNTDIQYALAPFFAMTSHTSASVHAIPGRELMFDISPKTPAPALPICSRFSAII
jgi:hypothetical protein